MIQYQETFFETALGEIFPMPPLFGTDTLLGWAYLGALKKDVLSRVIHVTEMGYSCASSAHRCSQGVSLAPLGGVLIMGADRNLFSPTIFFFVERRAVKAAASPGCRYLVAERLPGRALRGNISRKENTGTRGRRFFFFFLWALLCLIFLFFQKRLLRFVVFNMSA